MLASNRNRSIRYYLIVLAAYLSTLSSMSSAEEGWTRKADMPIPRWELSTTVANGKIYAIGGRAGSQLFSIVEVYDPAADTWTRKTDMPTARNGLSTCVVDGRIYAIGGVITGGPVPTVEEYDPVTDTWTKKTDMPTDRSNLSTGVVNGKIYAIGGGPRGVAWGSPILEEYNPVTDTWSRRADMPTPRTGLSASVVDGKIYVIGGLGPRDFESPGTKGGMILSTVEEYDPATDTWTRKADMPTARSGLSTTAVHGIIYAIGGNSEYGQAINVKIEDALLSTVEAYDPATDTWTKLPDMPTPRTGLSASSVNSMIYVIGGQPGSWPTVTGVVEAYSTGPWEFAANPSPADGALYFGTWAGLGWTPGDFAASHDVYFSEDFEDVNAGTAEVFRGNQAAAFHLAGLPGFTYPEGLDSGTTYYWRVDEVNDLHQDSPWKGDVWSFTIPSAKAYNPGPANGTEFVDLNAELSWTEGLGAILHTVYFGDTFDDLDNATDGIQQAVNSYDPGPLQPARTYYWRVDETTGSQGSETHKGDVWSFTTVGFAVDDFESYNDIDPPDLASNRIFDNWMDGFGTTDNGALVGNDFPPYAEQTVVHSGTQSMPYRYDNNMKSSEAVLTLAFQRDWTVDGMGLLSLWFRGYPAFVGTFIESPTGTYTMTGAGSDIWNQADEFHYGYKRLSGAGSIVARVDSIENTHNWAKAGVMIRETLDPDSANAFVCLTASQGVNFQGRNSVDGKGFVTNQIGVRAPRWLKLERDVAGTFRGFHSADGSNWQPVENSTQVNIPMNSDVYIGLAVTSHSPSYSCEAVFSNVGMSGAVSPQWTSGDVGMLTNDAEPLYVAISDSGGVHAVIHHDDPDAATIDTWTPWNIDLNKFAEQGIDLTDVDRIAIGLGAQRNATPGGSGKMYFDDIRLYRPRAE